MSEATQITLCSQKEPDGSPCKEVAKLSYRWDWGLEGACCQRHGLLLQQTSASLSRGISVTPLNQPIGIPLERSERTQLMAAKLAAEAEADEIKARGAELYNANMDLTRQVQTLTLKLRESEAAHSVKDKQLNVLNRERDERMAQLADLTNEVQRLTTLSKFNPDTQPSIRS